MLPNLSIRPKTILRPLQNSWPRLTQRPVLDERNHRYVTYDRLKTETLSELLSDLGMFLSDQSFLQYETSSFVAIFKRESCATETEFREKYWEMLQALYAMDDAPWNSIVENQAAEDSYCFSLCGQGFYINGLHPGSKSKDRRAPHFTVVFAPMQQFDKALQNSYMKVDNPLLQAEDNLGNSEESVEELAVELLAAQGPFLITSPPYTYDGLHLYDLDEEEGTAA